MYTQTKQPCNQHQLQTTLKKTYSLINQNVSTNIINMSQRRYDIDALRSIAMFLLIFYHLGISFTSIAPQISFVQNKRVADGIWPLLNLMNSWRIPLVFLIAGVALRLSFRKRTWASVVVWNSCIFNFLSFYFRHIL